MDAVAAYSWLVASGVDTSRIVLFGHSLGGAVASRLLEYLVCSQDSADRSDQNSLIDCSLPLPLGLVIENSFTSLRDVAVEAFPALGYVQPLLRWPLLLDEWRSWQALRNITAQQRQWGCCFLSGLQDEVVPPTQMRALHDALSPAPPAVLSFNTFKNGTHDDTPAFGGETYWACLHAFLSELQILEHRSKS